jgi:tetratricopeptide (TPR) repeat protein
MNKKIKISILAVILLIEIIIVSSLFLSPNQVPLINSMDEEDNEKDLNKSMKIIDIKAQDNSTNQDNSVTQNNSTMKLLIDNAINLSGNGRLVSALEETDKCLEMYPEQCRLEGLKGHILHQIGRYEEAIIWYDLALVNYPKSYDWLFGKSYCQDKLGNYEDAIDSLDKILVEHPTDSTVLNNKAWALSQLGRYTEALEIVNLALENNDDDIDLKVATLHTKVYILYELEDYEEALVTTEECLESASNYESCREYRVMSLEALSIIEMSSG